MATMLAFVTTDAAIEPSALQAALRIAIVIHSTVLQLTVT